MKKVVFAIVVLFLVGLQAQTTPVFGPPTIGSDGPISTSPTQCSTAPAHGYLLCPVETGVGTGALYISINGSKPALLTGAIGPVGPAGPTGATGPQGPAGPNPSVTSVNGKTGAVVLSLQ